MLVLTVMPCACPCRPTCVDYKRLSSFSRAQGFLLRSFFRNDKAFIEERTKGIDIRVGFHGLACLIVFNQHIAEKQYLK